MKKFTKIVPLLAASALLVLLPTSNALTASAATPETYTIFYSDDEKAWCYANSEDAAKDKYDDDIEDLYDEIKDGDHVVIFGDDDEIETFELPVRLSTLTVMNCGSSYVIVHTNGINEVQAGNGAVFSVTGDVQNAYVHNDAEVTFHGQINMLSIETDNDAEVACKNTVAHAICINDGDVEFDIYNVAADKLRVDNGELETEAEYYSTTPVSAPAAAPSTQPSSTPASSNDYDDVPKTGEAHTVYLLLAAAVLCLAGSRALKRA